MSKFFLFKKVSRLIRQADLRNEPHSESRREFLKTSLAASTLLLPLTPILNACQSLAVQKSSPAPVAILGGGIAGLTAAYALAKAGRTCEIYEATSRLGGRMFSKLNFNSEQMSCELGGEFVDTDHEEIIALCKELGVELDALSPGDQGLVSNLYYFQGKYWTDEELIPRFQNFAKKLRDDQKRIEDPSFARQMDQISLEKYLQQFRNVDKWIIDMIRVAYTGEYGLDTTEQSSLNLIGLLSPETHDGFKIFGDSDQEFRIRGGNQSLISALENFLLSRNVKIYKNSPVQKFKEVSNGIAFTVGNETKVFPQVICSIPFSVLRHIEGIDALQFSALKKKCIQEVGYATCSKLMIGYRSRIWRQGLTKNKQKILASNGMVYTDLSVQNLWETSRAQKGNSGILTCYTGGKTGAQVSAKDLDRFLKANEEIFPGTLQEFDQNSAAMNWTNASYSKGAYACPKPGQVTEFENVAGLPELGNKFIFAGEHTDSKSQGYMNGGCRSGLKAAQFILETKS